ncbi:MAG: hypothetical protein M0R20_01420 [Candidatus Omnitrophica bacterium]|jgi:Na+/H+-dicarboxylate symporter|nr:hypothetical protein [Candidatus Omnitrophota bacterium]
MGKEGDSKEKGCNCEVETPEMMLWGFIGFIVGIFVGLPFKNKWITVIAVIFFSSLFSQLCRWWHSRRKNNI